MSDTSKVCLLLDSGAGSSLIQNHFMPRKRIPARLDKILISAFPIQYKQTQVVLFFKQKFKRISFVELEVAFKENLLQCFPFGILKVVPIYGKSPLWEISTITLCL